jgi:hypothetical protein
MTTNKCLLVRNHQSKTEFLTLSYTLNVDNKYFVLDVKASLKLPKDNDKDNINLDFKVKSYTLDNMLNLLNKYLDKEFILNVYWDNKTMFAYMFICELSSIIDQLTISSNHIGKNIYAEEYFRTGGIKHRDYNNNVLNRGDLVSYVDSENGKYKSSLGKGIIVSSTETQVTIRPYNTHSKIKRNKNNIVKIK